jgi:hypothetical protein
MFARCPLNLSFQTTNTPARQMTETKCDPKCIRQPLQFGRERVESLGHNNQQQQILRSLPSTAGEVFSLSGGMISKLCRLRHRIQSTAEILHLVSTAAANIPRALSKLQVLCVTRSLHSSRENLRLAKSFFSTLSFSPLKLPFADSGWETRFNILLSHIPGWFTTARAV